MTRIGATKVFQKLDDDLYVLVDESTGMEVTLNDTELTAVVQVAHLLRA